MSESDNISKLYAERLKRYTTAMRNEKPDRVPIRIFAAEFIAKYSGYTCQEITYDYEKAFEATRKCAKDFHWDATMVNAIYTWGGYVDSVGLKFYQLPGRELLPNMGFQYIEPPEEEDAYMRSEDYDLLIENPTEYLVTIWWPRISKRMVKKGEPNTFGNNVSWLKGAIAWSNYMSGLGEAVEKLKTECGTVSAICGILKSPFDLLADRLRGFRQLVADVYRRPNKVMEAIEALTPHILKYAILTSDPNKQVPVAAWLHRGTLFSAEMYQKFFWPPLKYMIEELWKTGIQTLWYGEGDWGKWMKYTAQLPERSIVYHVDQEDIFEAHKFLGDKFCISGGIPNDLLAFGTPEEVKERCKKVLKTVAKNGGYIMDAGAILQSDTKAENLKAMTEAISEYGVY